MVNVHSGAIDVPTDPGAREVNSNFVTFEKKINKKPTIDELFM